MKSNFLSLHTRDLIKGFITAVLAAVLTGIYTAISNNQMPEQWQDFKPIVVTGIGAGIAYLIKNLFTNSNDELLKPEQPVTPPSISTPTNETPAV